MTTSKGIANPISQATMIHRSVPLAAHVSSTGFPRAACNFASQRLATIFKCHRHIHQQQCKRPRIAPTSHFRYSQNDQNQHSPRHHSQSRRSLSVLRPRFRGRTWTWPELTSHIVRHEPLILAAVLIASLLSGAALYRSYKKRELARRMGPYPVKVGLAIYRGLYFAQYEPEDPAKSINAFSEALQAAAKAGFGTLSNEVIGIKAELSNSLDSLGQQQNAVNVLETVRADILAWINTYDTPDADAETQTKRNELLAWACRLTTRVADLYGKPDIFDQKKLESNLVWVVETTLKERQRRRREGLPWDKDNWLNDDEMGSILEDLAHSYENQDNFYYASQLFLRALSLKTETDCHTVVLMNNLAASIAQQHPTPEPGTPPMTKAQRLDSSKAWALQALTLSQKIKPPQRNEECDAGCVVATHNLGEFAEMDGNLAEARERYEQAASLAHAYGFEEGIANANAALNRVGGG